MKQPYRAGNYWPDEAGQQTVLPFAGDTPLGGGQPSEGQGATWTDAGLIAALQARDEGAIAYAVETYAPKLYRFAVYQLGDAAAAEDLVSEVITRMLEKIDSLRYTGAPFQAWLFSIARNLVTDSYRRKNRAQILSLDRPMAGERGLYDGAQEPAAQPAAPSASDFDSHIETLADREVLVKIMGSLTPEQRQIVTLRVIEGWQPAEIAQLLGKSIDSVKSLQYRALQSLRRFWERDVPTDGRVRRPGTGSRAEEALE